MDKYYDIKAKENLEILDLNATYAFVDKIYKLENLKLNITPYLTVLSMV